MRLTLNIFIVDDDFSTRELYKQIFEILGANIIDMAKNGEEAIIKFQKFTVKPDLIIMDYHMPFKNGIEATQAILEIDKTAKVIIISGNSSIKETSLAIGAICFKSKPISIFELNQEIQFFKKQKENYIEYKKEFLFSL